MKGLIIKFSLYLYLFLFLFIKSWAQQNLEKLTIPVKNVEEVHQVSGIVLDSVGKTIVGANIKLKSDKDSLITVTNDEGIFIFEHVQLASFTLTISKVGFSTIVKRFLNNYLTNTIVLDPIILGERHQSLKEVVINGSPTIKYKVDTVEYIAGDYVVPPYARVDELLKKMEGMEVGKDGTLTHQGQEVVTAKLNGKNFAGGDIKQAIQNLPASIVEKIQIIDDYGELAAKTGIKEGTPRKALNITTKPDKSIGTFGFIETQAGNKKRFKSDASIDNINANKVMHVGVNFYRMINGIASNDPLGSMKANRDMQKPISDGLTKSASPVISYANKWNDKLSVVWDYTYNFIDNFTLNNSYGETYYSSGISKFNNENITKSNYHTHNLNFKIEYDINTTNFIQFMGHYGYNAINQNDSLVTENLREFTSGFEHSVANLTSSIKNPKSNYNLSALYLHLFKKPKRIFSLQVSLTNVDDDLTKNSLANYRYYHDSTQSNLISDSLSNLLTYKSNITKVYRSILTYVEPINENSRIEFTGNFRQSIYSNEALSKSMLLDDTNPGFIKLNSIDNYTFSESRLLLDYRYSNAKSDLTLGVAFIPSTLSTSATNSETVLSSTTDFKVTPVFRFAHSFSNVERFQLTYSGVNREPYYYQVQPFEDFSDPNNIIIGNPKLKPTFIHTIGTSYNRYFSNSKVNISTNVEFKIFRNEILANIKQITEGLTTTANKTVNLISYINLNGNSSLTGKYSISKQLGNRRFKLELNGDIVNSNWSSVSNDIIYHSTEWRFNERFGPRLSFADKIDINPYIGFDVSRSSVYGLNVNPAVVKIARLAVDGSIDFLSSLRFHYEANKNFVKGFVGYNSNPLIINAGFEKFFLRQKNLILTFDIFDILQQNHFIQRTITPLSNTFTSSNMSSRYFLIGLRMSLQKWGGMPSKNGQPMKRRGDGSFMN